MILMAAVVGARAQGDRWESVGPFGGGVAAVLVVGDTVLAAPLNNGVVRSVDAGAHWARVLDPFGADPVRSLFAHRGILFACGQHDYRSTDGGATWGQMDVGAAAESFGMCAVADTLYLASLDGTVHRSVDGGVAWSRIGEAHGDWPGAFVAHRSRLYLSLDAGFYSSDDGGLTWNPIDIALTEHYVDAFAANDSAIVVSLGARLGGTPDRLYRSTDRGVTWAPAHDGITADRVHQIIWDGAEFLACGADPGGLCRSPDGVHWTPVPGLTGEFLSIGNSGAIIVAGGGYSVDGRLYRSLDRGGTWHRVDGAYSSFWIPALVRLDDGTVIASVSTSLVRSTDAGTGWERVPVDTGVSYAQGPVAARDALLMVPTARQQNGVDRSTDGGVTWRRVPVASTHTYRVAASGALVFALVEPPFGDGYDVYRSTDRGESWSRTAAKVPYAGTDTYVTLDVVRDRVFAATSWGLYRTLDSGRTWYLVTQRFAPLACVAVGHTDNVVVVADVRGDTSGIQRSTDGGDTWQRVYTGRTDDAIIGFAAGGSVIIAWYREHGVLRSADDGLTWGPMNLGLENGRVRSAVAAGPYFLIGTEYGGIFRAAGRPMAVANDRAVSEYRIAAAVYPNPCRRIASIEYIVPEGAPDVNAEITLHDRLGARMADIFNGRVEPGMHRAAVDAATLAAGAYYCRLRVGSVVRTLRLVVAGE